MNALYEVSKGSYILRIRSSIIYISDDKFIQYLNYLPAYRLILEGIKRKLKEGNDIKRDIAILLTHNNKKARHFAQKAFELPSKSFDSACSGLS